MEALHEFLNELKTDLAMEDQERLQRELLDRERFLKEFPQVKKELEESIRKLYALADRVDKSHGDCTIFKVVANSTGTASSFLNILGLALAPVTAGASLALSTAGLGLGAAAAGAAVSTSYKENASRSAAETEANSLMATGVKKWKVLLRVLRSNSRIRSAEKLAKAVQHIQKNIRAMETGKDNPEFATNVSDYLGPGKIIVPGTRLVKKACCMVNKAITMAPAAVTGARIVGAATAGVFLLVDVGFLVRESMHLQDGAKAESAESLRQRARELERNLQELNNMYDLLQ